TRSGLHELRRIRQVVLMMNRERAAQRCQPDGDRQACERKTNLHVSPRPRRCGWQSVAVLAAVLAVCRGPCCGNRRKMPPRSDARAGQHLRWINAAKPTNRVFYVYVQPGSLRFFGKINTTEL